MAVGVDEAVGEGEVVGVQARGGVGVNVKVGERVTVGKGRVGVGAGSVAAMMSGQLTAAPQIRESESVQRHGQTQSGSTRAPQRAQKPAVGGTL